MTGEHNQRHQHLQETSASSGQGNICQNQQESVLQKFRKSFSLRFHKRGSKEGGSSEGDGQSMPPIQPSHVLPLDNDTDLSSVHRFNDEDKQFSDHHKDDTSDQKFRSVFLQYIFVFATNNISFKIIN